MSHPFVLYRVHSLVFGRLMTFLSDNDALKHLWHSVDCIHLTCPHMNFLLWLVTLWCFTLDWLRKDMSRRLVTINGRSCYRGTDASTVKASVTAYWSLWPNDAPLLQYQRLALNVVSRLIHQRTTSPWAIRCCQRGLPCWAISYLVVSYLQCLVYGVVEILDDFFCIRLLDIIFSERFEGSFPRVSNLLLR